MVMKKPVGVLTNFHTTAKACWVVSFQLCFSLGASVLPLSSADVVALVMEDDNSTALSVSSNTVGALIADLVNVNDSVLAGAAVVTVRALWP